MKQFTYKGENFIYYNPEEIGDILNMVSRETVSQYKILRYNSANAFDIETTSCMIRGKKTAFMYVWQLALENYVIVGRTWEEFVNVINRIADSMVLYDRRRLVIYVHNLAYEFQFIRKWFEWLDVFSIDERKPLRALTSNGIEFRCSYLLSGYSLKNLGSANNLKMKKLEGGQDLDYNLIRHSDTQLTDSELAYSIRDVQTVVEYIRKKMSEDGNIAKIPMTKTGYVRIECRKSCFGAGKHKGKKYHNYRNLMKRLTMEPEEYEMMKQAFQGGFTHGNPYIVQQCERGRDGKHYIENVGSYDIASSYPYVMVAENGFPMGKGEILDENRDFKKYLEQYACVFTIEFYEIQDKVFADNYISLSRCLDYDRENTIVNNGRVVESSYIKITITNIDYEIIHAAYNVKSEKCLKMYYYRRGYLPTAFITKVLEFYSAKTKLKGLSGEENKRRYAWGKENVNATYGCAVTDPCRDTILYDDVWDTEKVDVGDAIAAYNKNINRFLFYPWGVFVTAFARRRLWGLILACGSDYCYSDTDSVKVRNPDKYAHFFKKSDEVATKKLQAACKYHGFEWDSVAPKTIKGIPKQLGVWEYEETYHKFRTNGAKRYMVWTRENGLSLTVSGLNKKTAVPFLLWSAGSVDDAFKNFSEGLQVPDPYAGRQISTYIDYATMGTVIDYQGRVGTYNEKSSLHLCGSSYTMDYNEEYNKYLGILSILFNRKSETEILFKNLSIQ